MIIRCSISLHIPEGTTLFKKPPLSHYNILKKKKLNFKVKKYMWI